MRIASRVNESIGCAAKCSEIACAISCTSVVCSQRCRCAKRRKPSPSSTSGVAVARSRMIHARCCAAATADEDQLTQATQVGSRKRSRLAPPAKAAQTKVAPAKVVQSKAARAVTTSSTPPAPSTRPATSLSPSVQPPIRQGAKAPTASRPTTALPRPGDHCRKGVARRRILEANGCMHMSGLTAVHTGLRSMPVGGAGAVCAQHSTRDLRLCHAPPSKSPSPWLQRKTRLCPRT